MPTLKEILKQRTQTEKTNKERYDKRKLNVINKRTASKIILKGNEEISEAYRKTPSNEETKDFLNKI